MTTVTPPVTAQEPATGRHGRARLSEGARAERRLGWLLCAPAVGGTEGSPLSVRLACELRLLRHPRSLVRPYWREPE